jgi:hypothetical protein
LRALVAVQHGRITLKISGEAADPVRELVLRQGLEPNQLVESLVSAFLRSGLSIAPERLLQARALLERFKLDSKKFARLISIILEKGIDPRSRGLEQLLLLLGYGEEESPRQRGRQRRRSPDAEQLAEELRRDVQPAEGGEGSGVQVFNHLRGREHTWIIIPFDYRLEGAGSVWGSIRLRYDPRRQRTDRLVVAVRGDGGTKWSFVLLNREEPELFVFTDSAERRRRPELDVLLLKLQNLGVKTDDTIREDQNFDGFDLPWEELSYHNVDTVH